MVSFPNLFAICCTHRRLKKSPRLKLESPKEDLEERRLQSVDSESCRFTNLAFRDLRVNVARREDHEEFAESEVNVSSPNLSRRFRLARDEALEDVNHGSRWLHDAVVACLLEDIDDIQPSLYEHMDYEAIQGAEHLPFVHSKRTCPVTSCTSGQNGSLDSISTSGPLKSSTCSSSSELGSLHSEASVTDDHDIKSGVLNSDPVYESYRCEDTTAELYGTSELAIADMVIPGPASLGFQRRCKHLYDIHKGKLMVEAARFTSEEVGDEREERAHGWYIYMSKTAQRICNHHQLRSVMDQLNHWRMQVPATINLRYTHTSGVDVSLPWPDLGSSFKQQIQKFVNIVNKVEGWRVFHYLLMENSNGFMCSVPHCLPPPAHTSRVVPRRGSHGGAGARRCAASSSNVKSGLDRDISAVEIQYPMVVCTDRLPPLAVQQHSRGDGRSILYKT